MEEIKAGDIMLGNWFQVNGFLMYIDAIYSDMVSLDFKGNEGGSWEEYTKDLVPIPLTEDILLKCGFTKHRMSGSDVHFEYSIFLGGEVITIMAIYNAEFSIKMHSNARGVKYLHDIQNKIKAIAKTDLIFKI